MKAIITAFGIVLALAQAGIAEEASNGEAGKQLFVQTCSPCHGMDAKGVPGLGRDLTTSEFMKTKSDEELVAFVNEGRPLGDPNNNATIPMPPKAGNPNLTDEQILEIITYIRTLNGS